MPQERYQNFLIIGGGIGGLSAALALARKGIASQVFERRAPDEADGAGIQIGPNGVTILRALGIADLLKGRVSEPKQINVRLARSGASLTNLPLGAWIAARHGAPYWTLQRSDLHAALRQAADSEPLIEVHYAVKVSHISERMHYAMIHYGDDTTVKGRGVINAGGLWADIAHSELVDTGAQPQPQPTGKSAFRATVPASSLSLNDSKNETIVWLHPGAHVVSYPVSGGHERALVLILQDTSDQAHWNRTVKNHEIATRISNFTPQLTAMLNSVESWRGWPLFVKPSVPSVAWSTPRTTQLGDASTPVLPFLAQGGVMALEDSAVLANTIASENTNLEGALHIYETERRPRRQLTAQASLNNGRIYHLSGLMAAARNTSLRLVPAERLMHRYDWLYGWKPPQPASL
ncbi:MAG: FAD-dependent monooxygenase [Hyphomicrobiaceae bacterium]